MQTNPVPFILDTDMGADDFMALALLLNSPSVALQAVTVTGTGISHLDPGTQSALDILQLGGQPNVPVAQGATRPLQGDHQFPTAWRHATDKRFGIALPQNPNGPSALDAATMLTQVIQASSQKPILLAIGPLTNVATALQNTPSLAEGVAGIYIMGGAVKVPGNVHATDPSNPNQVAEWNFYTDPVAANIVLTSGAPITLVSLDVTQQAPVTEKFLHHLKKIAVTPLAQFVVEVLEKQKTTIDQGQYDFWDPLAAALAINPSLAGYTSQALSVNTQPGPTTWGQVSQNGPSTTTRYGSSVQLESFTKFFVGTLLSAPR